MRHCPHTYIRTALITTMTPNTSTRVRWPVTIRAAADAKTSV